MCLGGREVETVQAATLENSVEFSPTFTRVPGPGSQGKSLYHLSHFASPQFFFVFHCARNGIQDFDRAQHVLCHRACASSPGYSAIIGNRHLFISWRLCHSVAHPGLGLS